MIKISETKFSFSSFTFKKTKHMKKNLSRTCLLAVAAIAMVAMSAFNFKADKANFSGEWKLDASKSELGDFGGMAATGMKVEQKDTAITISRTSPGFNGGEPRTTMIMLPYSGATIETEGFGGSKRKASLQWGADGQTLTINNNTHFERDGQAFDIKSTESWTMKDGMLTVATTATTPQGDINTKAVYTK